MHFHKLHGLGNDYVVLDERREETVPEAQKPDVARELTSRGFGPGADGVLYLSDSEGSDIRMRIFNVDGSEAESCGNGLRCCAYYYHGLESPGQSNFEIELPLAEPVTARVSLDQPPIATVELGMSIGDAYRAVRQVELDELSLEYHYVDVGNPHAVIFLSENKSLGDSLSDLSLKKLGQELQTQPDFAETNGINAEFVRPRESNEFEMRVFERGVGETTSCGTGSIAVATAAGQLNKASGNWITVRQPGGELEFNPVKANLRGPAAFVYSGTLAPGFLTDVS